MPKKPEAQSFEVAEYSEPALDNQEVYSVIKQVFVDMQRTQSQHAVWADWSGDMLKIHYHSFEAFMPEKMRDVEQRANEIITNTVKILKKEFKERTGKTLKLADQKEMADSAREKVSLNQRYYYKAWRFYKISF